jgi:hypothetical protein
MVAGIVRMRRCCDLPDTRKVADMSLEGIGRVYAMFILLSSYVFPDSALPTSQLSIAELCNVGCVATYRQHMLTIYSAAGLPIIEAPRSTTSNGLWRFDVQHLQLPSTVHQSVPPGFEPQPHAAYDSTMWTQTMEERVNFIHRTASVPVLSTFREAVNRGHLRSIRALTLSRHPLHAFETPVGHIRQFTASTHYACARYQRP